MIAQSRPTSARVYVDLLAKRKAGGSNLISSCRGGLIAAGPATLTLISAATFLAAVWQWERLPHLHTRIACPRSRGWRHPANSSDLIAIHSVRMKCMGAMCRKCASPARPAASLCVRLTGRRGGGGG